MFARIILRTRTPFLRAPIKQIHHHPNLTEHQLPTIYSSLEFRRFKSKGSKSKNPAPEETSGSEESGPDAGKGKSWDDQLVDKNSRIMNVVTKSLRVDGLLKSGLGIARNKVEIMFYDSKLRINGQKLLKKATMASVGDEIDVVRGPSPSNPDFLEVSRVEVLDIVEKGENWNIKLRRTKVLTIENYDEQKNARA